MVGGMGYGCCECKGNGLARGICEGGGQNELKVHDGRMYFGVYMDGSLEYDESNFGIRWVRVEASIALKIPWGNNRPRGSGRYGCIRMAIRIVIDP